MKHGLDDCTNIFQQLIMPCTIRHERGSVEFYRFKCAPCGRLQ